MKYLTRTATLFVIALAIGLSGCKRENPKNLILFIGDGMGLPHIHAAMTVAGEPLTILTFPVTGFSRTSSANSYTTDSAAGGTAISTGEKTNNRMVAMRPDSTQMMTLLEYAKNAGLSTGVVVTSSLSDATPASFVSHVPSRYEYREISHQYANGAADIFIGGGREHFEPAVDSAGNVTDATNTVSELLARGYDVTYDLESFEASSSNHIAGLMSTGHMPTILDGRDPGHLARATAKALSVLSKNPKGFILVIEGSEIDHQAHKNNLDGVTSEVIDMDRAVAVARHFAESDGHTLIVITADHETGGMSITSGDFSSREIKANFSLTGHSGIMVPVFAYGPGAMQFSGVNENTDLFRHFMRLLSLESR